MIESDLNKIKDLVNKDNDFTEVNQLDSVED